MIFIDKRFSILKNSAVERLQIQNPNNNIRITLKAV